MKNLVQDVKYAMRMLAKWPGFTILAVSTLALGIGANTAIFSVVNAVLLRSLPFADVDKLVMVWSQEHKEGVERRPVSYPDFLDWQKRAGSFERMAAVSSAEELTLTGGEEAQRVGAEYISAEYFATLGAQPALGRAFRPEENETPGSHPITVISHKLWQERFAGAADVLGKSIGLNDASYTIIGVMPAGFRGMSDRADLWLPFMMVGRAFPAPPSYTHDRRVRWHAVIASLRPGRTIEQARLEVSALARQLAAAYPDTNKNFDAMLVPMKDAWVGEYRQSLIVLFAAVGFLLLAACANLANLFLSKVAERRREITIRAAVGASRARLLQQLLTEGTVLALAGGAAGVLLAYWSLDLLTTLIPLELPSFVRINLDGRVLGITLAMSALCGVLFAVAPAWNASRMDLAGAMREGRGGGAPQRRRAARFFAVAQAALAVVLLVGAGLMAASLRKLADVDTGFRSEGVVTARVHVGGARYESEDGLRQLVNAMDTRLAAAAGMDSVGLVQSDLPPRGGFYYWNVLTDSARGAEQAARVARHNVSPGFFRTLEMPIVRVRGFTERDTAGAPLVAVVSESAAQRLWPGENPIGRRVRRENIRGQESEWLTVIGVVRDVKYRGRLRRGEADADLYLALYQMPVRDPRHIGIVARGRGEAAVAAALRTEMKSLDAALPLYAVEMMSERLGKEAGQMRFTAVLMACFGAIALLVAVLGIYGVQAHAVVQRTHEFGIRMALGAERSSVLLLALGEGGRMTGLGLALGTVGAAWLTRFMSTLLYGVAPNDPFVFFAALGILGAAAFAAIAVPAMRATRVDPLVALRYE